MENVSASWKPFHESLLLIAAIVAGASVGLFTSFETSLMDYFIIAMLFMLFYTISLEGFFDGVKNKKYLFLALMSNFVVLPLIAFLLSSALVDRSNAIFVGLVIYLVAPCTDWYLGFTKLAHGDVEVNSALLPFNLLLQVVLLPVYLYLFTANTIDVPLDVFFDVLIYWAALPFVAAQFLRWLVSRWRADIFPRSHALAERFVFVTLLLLVFSIFNVHVESLIANTTGLPSVFGVILIFFITAFFLARFTARSFALSKKQEISLTMTMAARNAPLMLVISLVFFPQQPLIHLVLVVGMLLEFPHLITITQILKSGTRKSNPQEFVS
ncbi:MAG: bile acid:sodium symporter [Bacteroidota bacterium]